MNYLRDHPEKRDKQAGILAWLAMQKAFPCQPPAGDGKGLPEAPKAGKGHQQNEVDDRVNSVEQSSAEPVDAGR